MRTVLFRWCGDASPYAAALAAVGAAPELVVPRADEPIEQSGAFVERLRAIAPDVVIVAGWGRRLEPSVLYAARLGTVNVHPSLLPSYRGKHPVFWALLHGERQVGVTVHRATEVIDGGPILAQRALDVPAGARADTLERALDEIGASLVADVVARVADRGELPVGATAAAPGSYFPPVRPEDGQIDWRKSADAIERLVRACSGVIEAFTLFRGMRVVVLDAELASHADAPNDAPGVVHGTDDAIEVRAGSGLLRIVRAAFLRRIMGGADLAATLGIRPGDRFG